MRHVPPRPAFRASKRRSWPFESLQTDAGGPALSPSLNLVTGRFVEYATLLPRQTYPKETLAAIDFRKRLRMTSPKSLLRSRDSNSRRMRRNPLWFSARRFIQPSLPCGDRSNCDRLGLMRDRIGSTGHIFYGLIIAAIFWIDGIPTGELRLRVPSL